jgi:hypothetical protein
LIHFDDVFFTVSTNTATQRRGYNQKQHCSRLAVSRRSPRPNVAVQPCDAIFGAEDNVNDDFAERLRHSGIMAEKGGRVNCAFSADEFSGRKPGALPQTEMRQRRWRKSGKQRPLAAARFRLAVTQSARERLGTARRLQSRFFVVATVVLGSARIPACSARHPAEHIHSPGAGKMPALTRWKRALP